MSWFWKDRKNVVTQPPAAPGLPELSELAGHPSGYKREDAVRRLGALGDPAALAVLIPRVNDWVPQVRAAALEAIRRLMVPAHASVFVSFLPAVFHLARCGRVRHDQVIEEISEYLVAPVNAEAVRQGLAAPDPRVRRLCYELAFDHQLVPAARLVAQAIHDPDVIIQGKSATRIASVDSSQIQDVLARALESPAAGVRQAALQRYLEQPLDESVSSTVRRFALDDNSSVRSVAVDWLRGRGMDVAEVFLQALRNETTPTRRVRAAILGIAENNLSGCLPEVLEKWESDRPSIRSAVLQAAAKLDPDGSRILCEKALADASPAVVKLACRGLRKLGVRFDADRLVTLVTEDRREVAAHAALYLSRQSGKWERLVFLLRIADLGDSGFLVPVLSFKRELSDWLYRSNRSAATPTAAQLAELRDLVETVGHHLSREQHKELRFTLQSTRARG